MIDGEDDVLELDDAIIEVPELEDTEPEDGEGVDIIVGDDETPLTAAEPDNATIQQLRKRIREQGRELTQYRVAAPAPQIQDPGEKPTIESCGFDQDVFEQAYSAWHAKATALADAQAKHKAEIDRANRDWQDIETAHRKRATSLRLPDYDDAEDEAVAKLTPAQVAVIKQGFNNSEAVFYALGKRPGKLAELAAIKNLAQFTVATAIYSKDIKMVKRTPAAPATVTRGTAAVSSSGTDKHLDRLEAEAARTNDRTKIVAYKAELKRKAAR